MTTAGSELKRSREQAKVSRQEIAARLGLTYSMVQRIEEGWREMPEAFPCQFREALAEITRERLEALGNANAA